MRQSTLLFRRGGGGSGNGHMEGAVEASSSDDGVEEVAAPPPAKKARRAAASKSEEKSKRQMQMQTTLGKNGKLQRSSPEPNIGESSLVVDDDNSSEVETLRTKLVVKKPTTEVKIPISLSVKGTLGGSTTAHSFFAKRPAVKSSNAEIPIPARSGTLSAAAKQKWPQQREAPWPNSNNMHVHPAESTRTVMMQEEGDIQLPRRNAGTQIHHEEEARYPWMTQASIASSSNPSRSVENIKELCKTAIPAFKADGIDYEACKRDGKLPGALAWLMKEAQTNQAASNEGLWTDRWRPMKADQVLGNEQRSLLLRNWLKELEVTGEVKGGRVIKNVERRKKRAKGEADDFIVDDEDEAWFDQFRKPAVEGSSEADLDQKDVSLDYLMNAIILQGPTGSGKTAAVYACAAELGFEVFEIYPGSGRRSGKDIGHAVGNLGRNHMVSSGGMGGGATWKGSRSAKTFGEVSKESDSCLQQSISAPRQSLILLEEVDLLYEEDKGFWAAVVELISTSKRPVVMTCNDLTCIPHTTFPIQAILAFEAPIEDEAVAYLQLMAACQGHFWQRKPIQNLYRSTTGDTKEQWKTSQFTIPASGPLKLESSLVSMDKVKSIGSSPDLRQAIMQLQFLCQRESRGKGPEEGEEIQRGTIHDLTLTEAKCKRLDSSLREQIGRLERRSFCDAYLEQPFERASEVLEPDEYESDNINNVQVQGAIILPKARVKLEVTTLASLSREDEFIQALLGIEDEFFFDRHLYDRLRHRESSRIDTLMRRLCPGDFYLNLSPHCSVIETAPMIGNMVEVDDDEQATYQTRLTQVLGDIQQNLSENGKEGLDSASKSLLQIGIRPSRHTLRILLERGGDGSLALSKREIAPCRWIQLDNDMLSDIRHNRLAM